MSEKGEVKFYNSKKGFGFIEREGKSDVHFGRDSFKGKAPLEGDNVEFDVVEQPKGYHAKNLKIISQSSLKSGNIRYILPADTREAIRPENVDNFALRLNKTPFFDSDKKFKFFKVDGNINILPDYSKLDIPTIANKHKHNIEKLNIETKSINLKPEWRMVIGLGNESVYETSMTLHHIYGIPYIPGSAIKGVIRNHIITEKFNKSEKEALKDEGFCMIFGSPKNSIIRERKGKVIFFDALPLKSPNIEPDIMNVHYPDYYGGKKPPADYQNPNPIFFLTVKETPFEFIIGKEEKDNTAITKGIFEGKSPLELAYDYINKALSEHGIGAKTSAGYGYFEEE